MKTVIGIVVCAIMSIATSIFFPGFSPGSGTVSTLYTISGIMFSIGMSLTVTSNTSGVKNKRIRTGIRDNLRYVRNHFIIIFLISSILFIILYPAIDQRDGLYINDILLIRYSHLLIFTTSSSIVFFILNFLSIQRLNIQIEDAINESSSN